MGAQLTAHGALVVSGMAEGIDGAAILGAQEAGGTPIGVLGTGVDIVYPKCNEALFSRIAEQGCLFSEYPPGTRATTWTFPQRNRIISGLSDAVLVVEAPGKSGALITARRAWEQGRQVFAAPGHIGEASFEGSLELMRDGAEMAACGWDILKHLEARYPGKLKKVIAPIQIDPEPPKAPSKPKKADPSTRPVSAEKPKSPENLSPVEKALYRVLTSEPQDVDTLIGLSGLSAGEFMSALTMLQLRGLAERHPDAMVSLR
jgi:DNA processing protein